MLCLYPDHRRFVKALLYCYTSCSQMPGISSSCVRYHVSDTFSLLSRTEKRCQILEERVNWTKKLTALFIQNGCFDFHVQT